MIGKILKIIQKNYQIDSKKLAEKSNISEKHLSQFRNGRSNLTYEALWNLILALEEIEPRSRIDLGLLIGGCCEENGEVNWEKIINIISEQDVALILNAIGKKIVNKQK